MKCLATLDRLQRVGRVVEGVLVALEQRQVRVHAAARLVAERLRHEGRVDALRERDLLDDVPRREDVVGGRERVGVPQVDLLLARRDLVVAELHRDAHALQHGDGVAAEVLADAVRREVEVPGGVDRLGLLAGARLRLEQEELDLGVRVEGEAGVGGLAERAPQDVPRVGPRRRPVRHRDVAEHAGRTGAVVGLAPRQHLERRRVGLGEHVALLHPGEALDRRAVEADPLGERALELGRRDGDGLQRPEDVGEPQPHEADVALLQRAEDELLLLVHRPIFAVGRTGAAQPPPSWVGSCSSGRT